MTAIYSAVHLLVDFACAYLMFSGIYGAREWYLCLLLYNFCAFAMQMPMGAAADALDKNARLSALGCVLIGGAYLVCALGGVAEEAGLVSAGVLSVMAAVTAGLGNGLFHVGGGLDVLNRSGENAGLLGVFVAPGALGVFLGTTIGKNAAGMREWPALLLVVSACAIVWAARREKRWESSGNSPVSYEGIRSGGAAAAVVCLLLVVVFRSYLGMIQDFSWKDSLGAGAMLAAATALGKMAGGFLADVAGMRRVAFASVSLAGILYLLSGCPAAGILAVFFWNMTMPLTLWAVAKLLPGAKGFTFGLLTFGLFLGFCPAYLGLPSFAEVFSSEGMGLTVLCAVSLVLLARGIREVRA